MVKTPLYVKVITGVLFTIWFIWGFFAGPDPGASRIYLLVMTPVMMGLYFWRSVRIFRGLDEMPMCMRSRVKNGSSRAYAFWYCTWGG